jgi:large subunit ribosomal protein L29
MKAEEMQAMSDDELKQEIEDARQELFNLRFQIETRKLKNHQRIPQVKRDIARMMTVLRERELIRQFTGEDVGPTGGVATVQRETPRRRGLFGRR